MLSEVIDMRLLTDAESHFITGITVGYCIGFVVGYWFL